ncbi:MAG: LysR family transcriptional regulator [Actinobacteria bacterium]|nr:LysR family transcriptional regulator [Actinomycetota bacterium]MBV9935806.1 LysR family transcriptional regulator [Actinomycetota bacterium]
MDLRQLSYFLAVVDEGTFTAAASRVAVAQPSLSQAVRALEAELGTELFHRVGRAVRLTSAGEALVEPARQALRDADTAREAVRAVAGLEAGRLDLAALPTLAAEPVAGLVGAFTRAHPGVSVRLVSPEEPGTLDDLVRSGECEIGFTELHPDVEGLVQRRLFRQDLLAVFPPGSPRHDTVGLRALAATPLVTTPPGTSSRRVIDDAFAAAGLTARVAVEANARDAILPLVLAGAGASLLPRPLMQGAAAQGAVVSAVRPPVHRDVGAVYRPGPLSPAARAFISLLAP